MDIKKYFCIRNAKEGKENFCQYAKMLGLNKDLKFVLSKLKVADETEFQTVCKEAEKILKNDFIRMGEELYKIPAGLRGALSCAIGSMTIVADNDGKLKTFFHRRDSDGYWDNETKKYPEKATTGKWKHEIFFTLDYDEI